MSYCPECGTEVAEEARFCPSCGTSIENEMQGKAGQPSTYQSGQPSHPMLSMRDLLGQSPLAKVGAMIVIAAVVGLIVSYAVPWGYSTVGSHSGDFFGHDLKNETGQHLFGSTLGPDVYDDAPGLADGGLIFLLVIGIILMVVGLIEASYGRPAVLFPIIGALLGGVAVIPSIWVTVAGVRFVGRNISRCLSAGISECTSELLLYPAAYLMVVIGLIFIAASFRIIRKEVAAAAEGRENDE